VEPMGNVSQTVGKGGGTISERYFRPGNENSRDGMMLSTPPLPTTVGRFPLPNEREKDERESDI